MGRLRIGTAGWSIPSDVAHRFPSDGSSLERYAARFGAAEINSSFHRPHRPSTYARWAGTVPADFRFSVKLPKTITHEAKLVGCAELVAAFLEESAGLGERCGPLLVQLPPSLAFDAAVADAFFRLLPGPVVCEPRHPSWFEPAVNAWLAERGVARVAADPALAPGAEMPGGWPELAYFRLHGSPRTYWSHYEEPALQLWAGRVRVSLLAAHEVWVMFDNTAGSGAAGNALRLSELLAN